MMIGESPGLVVLVGNSTGGFVRSSAGGVVGGVGESIVGGLAGDLGKESLDEDSDEVSVSIVKRLS